ncbi:UNKNOWN [Stylonychia lemnae]|uniref:Uncharacterized protein n=1 Tax=Stylonychia lemnae TaxID=5949 RepID=A0A077ZRU1_STYLE|nr:UNKNOWN [Stylonychia lemnae]|eukprot:CDW72194.1 UNKNOWN [Stylonychia lemnae]
MFLKYLQGTALFLLISITSDQAFCLQQRKLLQNSPSVLLKLELEIQGGSFNGSGQGDIILNVNGNANCTVQKFCTNQSAQILPKDSETMQKQNSIKLLDLSKYSTEKQAIFWKYENYTKYLLQKAVQESFQMNHDIWFNFQDILDTGISYKNFLSKLQNAPLVDLEYESIAWGYGDDISIVEEYIQKYGVKGGAFDLIQTYVSSYYDVQFPYADIIPDQTLFSMPKEEEYNSAKNNINTFEKIFYSARYDYGYSESVDASEFCQMEVKQWTEQYQVYIQYLPKLTKLQLQYLESYIKTQQIGLDNNSEDLSTYFASYDKFYSVCISKIGDDSTIPEL